MTELFEKSIHTLELPRVLSLLAEEAVSQEAKENALLLRPSGDPEEVSRRLKETTASRSMMDLKGAPSFREVRPVNAALQRADRGGTLSPRELLDIAGVLKATRTIKDYGSSDRQEKTCIDFLFETLHPNRFLEDKISGSILSEDEIADTASPELLSIRRHMKLANAKVRESLQKIISSSHYAKYLQDAIITMRSDRYVVPVRAECKGEIPGLVHDVSASGATVFIEPMSAVQANNELRELSSKEKKEIERILMELSADTAAHAADIRENYTLLVALDGIFARGKLSYRLRSLEPQLVSNGSILFRRARHPLLDPKTAVPIDVRLGSDFDTLVITGPNTGGKTVTLKTLGLLTLMAQCGLHIPVDDGSCLSVFQQVLSDIGDEQSIEQSLSTFSSHMTNIVRILGQGAPRTLILLDELGAGTDPVEGAALAIAIIGELREKGALVAATTHYAELKAFAMTASGVQNASCEFDVETLKPTYRLLIGVPGKSNAFAISARLGLPQHLIDRAKSQIDGENLRFEDVLSQLEQRRQEMEKEQQAAARLRLETEQNAKIAREYRERLEKEREKTMRLARAEARNIVEQTRRTTDEIIKELDHMRQETAVQDDFQAVNNAQSNIRRHINQAEAAIGRDSKDALPKPPQERDVQVGDTVELLSMKTNAVVLEIGKDGILKLKAGILNITAKPEEVRLIQGTAQTRRETPRVARTTELHLHTSAARELDLRGMMTDEAGAALDLFLDNAMMAKLEKATIIHGKGTGALRSAVQKKLKSSRYVKSYRLGRYGEGEDGVTIVELK